MGLLHPKKKVLGTEFVGKIEALGETVTTFNMGDDVFGFAESGVSSYAEYHRTYPFEMIPVAFRYVETQQKIGNVIINLTKLIT